MSNESFHYLSRTVLKNMSRARCIHAHVTVDVRQTLKPMWLLHALKHPCMLPHTILDSIVLEQPQAFVVLFKTMALLCLNECT